MDVFNSTVALHIDSFLRRLDDAFRLFGFATGLPARLREAVKATPRHRFVHRFRQEQTGPVHDFDADPVGLLPLIYLGQSLFQVGASGEPLPSTNSEAAYILWLVERLGIKSGDRILEVGSGSGWLLAVMSSLVGPTGSVTGVEIISELAAQSRTDLASLMRTNVNVLTADVTIKAIPGAPFDRAIVTAATWDLPESFFDLLIDGGRIIVPLRLRADESCDVVLLRREGSGFVGESSFPGFFVPLVGARQEASVERVHLDALPFWNEIGPEPSLSYPLWFGSFDRNQPGPATLPFRRYLALIEPTFAVFETKTAQTQIGRWMTDFGLIDKCKRSIAIYRADRILGFGAPDAAARLVAIYRDWVDLGMPGPSAFKLNVVPAASAPRSGGGCFVERRGASALVRTLDPGAGAWRTLI